MSPAPTVIVFVFRSRRLLTSVARYSTPPAGRVTTTSLFTAGFASNSQQYRIVPGVFGSRCPWKSLIASNWTCVSLSLFFGPFAANALGATMSAAARRATTSLNLFILSPDVDCFPPATRPQFGRLTVLHRDGGRGQPGHRRELLLRRLTSARRGASGSRPGRLSPPCRSERRL